MTAVDPAPTRETGLARLWREHEEGLLYVVAVLVYIPLGLLVKTVVLSWVIGPLFPLLVVYLIPTWVRRLRSRRRAEEGASR